MAGETTGSNITSIWSSHGTECGANMDAAMICCILLFKLIEDNTLLLLHKSVSIFCLFIRVTVKCLTNLTYYK